MDELLLRIGIENHLRYNHYPPVSLAMTDYCIKAIKHAQADEWDAVIEFPNGTMTAGDLVQDFHLDYFVQSAEVE